VLFGSFAHKRFARPDMGKLDRPLGDCDAALRLLRHGECRGGEIAGRGEIGAEMSTA
jgi:hypothetical protein